MVIGFGAEVVAIAGYGRMVMEGTTRIAEMIHVSDPLRCCHRSCPSK